MPSLIGALIKQQERKASDKIEAERHRQAYLESVARKARNMTPEMMEAEARKRDAENERRDSAALESAWDKIDNKIAATPGGVQTNLVVKFTLLELKMLRQFRRKFA